MARIRHLAARPSASLGATYGAYVVLSGSGIDPSGVADSAAAIQAKLNSAGTSGLPTHVHVPAGTFRLSTGLTIPSNVTIAGHSWGSKFRFDNGSLITVYSNATSNVTIRDLWIDHGTQTVNANGIYLDACTNWTIQNVRFTNGKMPVTLLNAVQNIRVLDCYFDSAVDYGVRVADTTSDSVLVRGCTFVNITLGAGSGGAPSAILFNGGTKHRALDNNVIATHDTGVMVTNSTATLVAGNTVRSRQVSVFVGSGSLRTRVIGNDLRSEKDYGVHLLDPSASDPSSHATISANVINDCGKSGVGVEGVGDTIITGNQITDCGWRTVDVDDVTPLPDKQRAGVTIFNYSAQLPDRTVVTGNVIRDLRATPLMKYGVYVDTAASGIRVANNVATGATVKNVHVVAPASLTAPYTIEGADLRLRLDTNFDYAVGTVPTVAAGAQAGTGATVSLTQGDDQAGVLQINTGTGASGGAIATVTYGSTSLPRTPKSVILTPANTGATSIGLLVTTPTATGFAVSATGPASSTTYFVNYAVAF